MINEEFDWHSVSSYLETHVTTAFVGPSFDERSEFFSKLWGGWPCKLVRLEAPSDSKQILISITEKGIVTTRRLDFLTGLKGFLEEIRPSLNTAVMDLSSLQHSVIMYLTKLFIQDVKPRRLFASYAQPEDYFSEGPTGEFRLSEELLGLRAVPGFARREKDNPVRLVALVGFEGDRLIKIIEDMKRIERVTPVIGFPSFRPGWQATSLKNCMRAIQVVQASDDIHKCKADSVFDAYKIINQLRPQDGSIYAIAPLGTRPHSMAAAIYATKHSDTMLIYDHPVEVTPRSSGVFNLRGYHLTSFIS